MSFGPSTIFTICLWVICVRSVWYFAHRQNKESFFLAFSARPEPESWLAYVIILVRAYTHGGWAHRQRISTTFSTQRNSQFFLMLLTGFEPRSFVLDPTSVEFDALPTEPQPVTSGVAQRQWLHFFQKVTGVIRGETAYPCHCNIELCCDYGDWSYHYRAVTDETECPAVALQRQREITSTKRHGRTETADLPWTEKSNIWGGGGGGGGGGSRGGGGEGEGGGICIVDSVLHWYYAVCIRGT